MTSLAATWAFELLEEGELHQLLEDEEALAREMPQLHCAACGHPITTRQETISINGSHEHTFTNPHGLVFRIGCFGAAPGCLGIGDATEAWTWFSGYKWRIAVCRQCRNHLGWAYRSEAADSFFGLILDRLVSPS